MAAMEERATAAEQELAATESRLVEAVVSARECQEAERQVAERATATKQEALGAERAS